jgi:hypothetical protein
VVGEPNIPSDIRGLLWEQFDPANPCVEKLELVLQTWGFRWQAPAGVSGDPPAAGRLDQG